MCSFQHLSASVIVCMWVKSAAKRKTNAETCSGWPPDVNAYTVKGGLGVARVTHREDMYVHVNMFLRTWEVEHCCMRTQPPRLARIEPNARGDDAAKVINRSSAGKLTSQINRPHNSLVDDFAEMAGFSEKGGHNLVRMTNPTM
jgi:hypothetical protein